jgi:hypothetical protein
MKGRYNAINENNTAENISSQTAGNTYMLQMISFFGTVS